MGRAFILCAALLVSGSAASLAQESPFAAMPFRAVQRESLATDLRASLDAQGNAQLIWQGELLLQVETLQGDGKRWQSVADGELAHQHWPYFHLDSALLWELLPTSSQSKLAPCAYRLRTSLEIQFVERSVRPHSSVGSSSTSRVRAAVLELAGAAGPLYVAIFAWGGGGTQWEENSGVWKLPATGRVHWPLAIVAAESEENLWFDIGQALRAVQTERSLKDWSAPTLCERCRKPQISELRLATSEDGSHLLLQLTLPQRELDLQHGVPVFSTLRVGALSMADHLIDAGPSEASYRLPNDGELAEQLRHELRAPDAYVRLLSQAGQNFEVGTLRIEGSSNARPSGPPAVAAAELPQHLSARLLSAQPNPFQVQTSIQVLVPSSFDEAFELNPSLRARLPQSPPFGQQPMLRLHVYNVKGKLVRVLYEATHALGEFLVAWDGRDDQGRPVAAGAYYVHLSLGQHDVTHRVTLLKP